MREVDDAVRAVDERDAEGDHRIQAADDHALENHPCGRRPETLEQPVDDEDASDVVRQPPRPPVITPALAWSRRPWPPLGRGPPHRHSIPSPVPVPFHASPAAVCALVRDITRSVAFSPESFEAAWLAGSTGPALGARFRGHVHRTNKGLKYWTLCQVTSCEPGRTFGFEVLTGGKALNTWTYVLAPAGEGTDVTESFRLTPTLPIRIYWLLLGWARGKTNREGMRTTLTRIKAVVEACTPDEPCPPCKTVSGKTVPVGTIAFRPMDTPGRPQHGIDGPHFNLLRANQAPRGSPQPCKCFWQPIGAVRPGELPAGAIPAEPFAN